MLDQQLIAALPHVPAPPGLGPVERVDLYLYRGRSFRSPSLLNPIRNSFQPDEPAYAPFTAIQHHRADGVGFVLHSDQTSLQLRLPLWFHSFIIVWDLIPFRITTFFTMGGGGVGDAADDGAVLGCLFNELQRFPAGWAYYTEGEKRIPHPEILTWPEHHPDRKFLLPSFTKTQGATHEP